MSFYTASSVLFRRLQGLEFLGEGVRVLDHVSKSTASFAVTHPQRDSVRGYTTV